MQRHIQLILAALLLAGCGDEPNVSIEQKAAQRDQSEVDPMPPNLPVSFTDHVQGYNEKQAPFEMVLIPGNTAKDIEPFYVGKTEVYWEVSGVRAIPALIGLRST